MTNFGLYVVKETGETRLLADSEFPLLLRFGFYKNNEEYLFIASYNRQLSADKSSFVGP